MRASADCLLRKFHSFASLLYPFQTLRGHRSQISESIGILVLWLFDGCSKMFSGVWLPRMMKITCLYTSNSVERFSNLVKREKISAIPCTVAIDWRWKHLRYEAHQNYLVLPIPDFVHVYNNESNPNNIYCVIPRQICSKGSTHTLLNGRHQGYGGNYFGHR